jgi:hypothetical protein
VGALADADVFPEGTDEADGADALRDGSDDADALGDGADDSDVALPSVGSTAGVGAPHALSNHAVKEARSPRIQVEAKGVTVPCAPSTVSGLGVRRSYCPGPWQIEG